ncbi:MAG: GlsB/YeaQ/YmgE family stress response membrane protein [Acidimicrobiia bacterium]
MPTCLHAQTKVRTSRDRSRADHHPGARWCPVGIVGSFVGGFLGWALFGSDLGDGAFQASGIIGSVVNAIIAALVYRAVTRRGHAGATHR